MNSVCNHVHVEWGGICVCILADRKLSELYFFIIVSYHSIHLLVGSNGIATSQCTLSVYRSVCHLMLVATSGRSFFPTRRNRLVTQTLKDEMIVNASPPCLFKGKLMMNFEGNSRFRGNYRFSHRKNLCAVGEVWVFSWVWGPHNYT